MALSDVIGQQKAVSALRGAMGLGRVASAYLFQGESGIGKRFTALNFIKALNCLSPAEGGDACDSCISCKKLNSGTHPDLAVIEPDGGQIKVDMMREAEEMLSLKSYEAKVKALIVDDAESMNPAAANAFLKTLEEPPPNSIIILVSASPDRLPETIRSRASRVNFTPLSEEDTVRLLEEQLESDADLVALARLSMGRPGLALKDDLLERRDGFLEALEEMLGGQSKPTWDGRQEVEQWFDMAFVVLRDIAVLRLSEGEGEGEGGVSPGIVNEDIRERLARMAKGADIRVIIELYGKLTSIRRYLGFNLNKAITWNYVGLLWRKASLGEI